MQIRSFKVPARPVALAAVLAVAAVAAPAQAQKIVGLTNANALSSFNAGTPQNGTVPTFITGLEGTAQSIVAIDTRPTTGVLYGLSTDSKIYTLDASTGAATKVANLSISLDGTSFGFDFNPVADTGGLASLRITSNTGQNLAVNANTGVSTAQAGLTFGGSSIGATGAAYRDNDANPATSIVELYYIDAASDALYSSLAPAGGVLTLDGALGFDVSSVIGFDIAGLGNTAFAGLTLDGASGVGSSLYTVDLDSGAATLVGAYGIGGVSAGAPQLVGLTVAAAIPEPSTYALMVAGLLGVGWAARRRSERSEARQEARS